MNAAVSIAARRWRHNTAAARVGGVVRQRLLMGFAAASSSSSDNCNLLRYNDDNNNNSNSRRQLFSSSTTTTTTNEDAPSSSPSSFAVVDHSEAYERSMQGRHGQQLALARLEGLGKDDLPFDPFQEEEQKFLEEEERRELLEANANGGEEGYENENDEDVYEDDGVDDFDDDDDLEDDDEEESSSVYNRNGSIRRKKSVLATLKAGYPSGGLFAIFELAGSQHKVTTDDLLVVNKLKPVEDYKIGSVHTFKDILLVGSSHLTMVGMPHVAGAEVDVMIEEITQDAKVIIFKKRRRKHSQRKNGYRRDLTLIRVLDIRLPEGYKEHEHVGRDSVDDLADVIEGGGGEEEEVTHFDMIGNADANVAAERKSIQQ